MIKEIKLIETARSYSRKVNIGNYESIDYFCSAKEEVPKSQAVKTSERLFQFCKDAVEKSIAEYHEEKLQKSIIKSPEQPTKGNHERFITKEEAKEIQIKAEELGAEDESDKAYRFNEIENLQKEQNETN